MEFGAIHIVICLVGVVGALAAALWVMKNLPVPERVDMPPVKVDPFILKRLASNQPAVQARAGISPQLAPEPANSEAISSGAWNELQIPAGMFHRAALQGLLEIYQPFTGLVVSIGVDQKGGIPRSKNLQWVADHIAGLLGQNDFACQIADQEFLIICPGERGAEAKRRFNHIVERLWDFQLRQLAELSVSLTSGGAGVENGSLAEAIASATQRMYQIKRPGKTISMDSVRQRKKFV